MWIPIFPPLFYPGAHTQDLTLDLQIPPASSLISPGFKLL